MQEQMEEMEEEEYSPLISAMSNVEEEKIHLQTWWTAHPEESRNEQ